MGNTMDQNQQDARPPLTRYEDVAKMIDHSLLRPELTEEQVNEGCRIAREYQVASVTVRPCDVDFAVRQMEGSGVPVGSVAGFPHGSSTTATKLYEARDLLRRGARDVDTEVQQMADACHEQRAILKVIFENAYLTDELKIVACRICGRAGADFVKTSTGFAPTGATIEDLRLMRAHTNPNIQIKAAGGVRTLDKAFEV